MPTPLRCDPKLFEKDLKSQVIIVTGANSGCGLETSRQLVKQGATVILACRSEERGKAAAEDVGGIFLASMDLSSLNSIRNFAKIFLEKYQRLDALINNAGIMACPFQKTKEGFEMQIGCNHLGHFLLFQLLVPTLLQTTKTTGKPSRFIALSSCAASETTMSSNGAPDIDFSDINWEKREYNEEDAYCASKLANYLHAYEAAKKYPSDQLISVALHPGWVQSNLDIHAFKKMFGDNMLGRFLASIVRKIFYWKGDMITAVDGAQTTLHCALADDIESGKFYSQFGIYTDPKYQPGGWPFKEFPNVNATPEKSTQLWELSEKLVSA